MPPTSAARRWSPPPSWQRPLRDHTIRVQRSVWTRRAPTWDHGNMPGLDRVVQAVLAQAQPDGAAIAVDLGCGTGQLALPLARVAARVIAVDVSPAMVDRLVRKAAEERLDNVDARVAAIESLRLPPRSVDLIVSNYALHHLRDPDKADVVQRAAQWLRPGGRLVVGDMMLGRGGDRRDRQIIAAKIAAMARRGPAGWWRLTKNAPKFLLRVQERPVSIAAWEAMLRQAGLGSVASRTVVAEAAVVWGTRCGGRQ